MLKSRIRKDAYGSCFAEVLTLYPDAVDKVTNVCYGTFRIVLGKFE